MSVTTVELTGLSKSYGATRALDGISLALGQRGHRPARAQRCREDDDVAHHRHRAGRGRR